jgi:hypothetical protein
MTAIAKDALIVQQQGAGGDLFAKRSLVRDSLGIRLSHLGHASSSFSALADHNRRMRQAGRKSGAR